MPENDVYLQMQGISKAFPGVQALKDVSFQVNRGEIHALVGENGAGKTTLMKILTGALPSDEGSVSLAGTPVQINSPADAQRLGISMIHQELSLVPNLTVGQNIYLGREPQARMPGFIDWPKLYTDAQNLLERLNVNVNARTEVADLSIAQQQMVEVATEVLFEFMNKFKEQGLSLIFISHRLEEVFEISDRVTVLRDGALIGTKAIDQLDEAKVVQMMVGRELGEMYPKAVLQRGDIVLETTNLQDGRELHGVSLKLYSGEILGIAGLAGAGRTALAETIFGVRTAVRGQVKINNTSAKINSPSEAIQLGMGLVPEDRKQQGLFLNMTVRQNIVLSALDKLTKWSFINFNKADKLADEFVKKLDIRTPSLRQVIRNLSGGNQQKAVIARWLTLNPRVLILDEPTRGIDVGTKAEIHALMDELAQSGVGVLMISSDLPEVLGVSDRILVMREGRLVGEFTRDQATQDKIMHAATGGKRNNDQ
jgi:ribose transport system ATP-binding protein